MEIRKKLNYPPYTDLVLITIKSKDYNACYNETIKIKEYLLRYHLEMIGPSSIINKLNNQYILKIIIKTKHLSHIYSYLNDVINILNTKRKIRYDIDINPRKI